MTEFENSPPSPNWIEIYNFLFPNMGCFFDQDYRIPQIYEVVPQQNHEFGFILTQEQKEKCRFSALHPLLGIETSNIKNLNNVKLPSPIIQKIFLGDKEFTFYPIEGTPFSGDMISLRDQNTSGLQRFYLLDSQIIITLCVNEMKARELSLEHVTAQILTTQGQNSNFSQ